MVEGEEKSDARGMKPRKTGKRLLMIAAILILLAVLLPVANSICCKHAIPDEFGGAVQGTFSSDTTHFVSRRIFVKADFAGMICGETREVDVAVCYNLWSIYRPGQVVRARLACTVYDDQIEGCNFGAPVTYAQAAEFATRTRNPNEPLMRILAMPGDSIVGIYRTTEPKDCGHFTIHTP